MKARTIEQRLRRFLLVVSGSVFAGAVVELLFAGHTESLVQFVPFVLCGLGLCAVIAAFAAPQRRTLLLLRIVMGLVALGGFFGVYEHVEHNLAFELEIRPHAPLADAFWAALHGASPLLAPTVLALAATLAVAATYRHPALEETSLETSPPH